MNIHARTAAIVAAAVTAILTAGCGGSGPRPPASASPGATTPGTTASPSAGHTAVASPAATGPGNTAGPGGPGRCHTGMLSAHVQMGNPGAGQRYASLVLTNSSATTCRVFGYPGMQLISASGASVPTDVVRTSPSPQLVTVAPGAPVFALLHWTVVPASGETANPCEPDPRSVHVTPPDETSTLTAAWPGGSVCQHGEIFVTPFRAGSGP